MLKDEKAYRRHLRFYAFIVWLITPFIKRKFNFEAEGCADIEGPFLLLANHNVDWDPLLVSVAVRKHLYYVASEHIFRLGFLSRLLEWFLAPIPRTKGSVESGAAMAILRHLRKGHSVGVFAEGNRSFNGLTCDIHPSTAKLVRSAGTRLVTLRFEGGYFTSPRWGVGLRRGKMKLVKVGVYEPEEIKQMSMEDIDALLKRDLYEDAYARQEEEHARFVGKNRAQYIESTLFLCPACGRFGSLKSEGDEVRCDCGVHAVYEETGVLTGAPYASITEWDVWQHAELIRRLDEAANDEALCADADAVLHLIDKAHQEQERVTGTLTLYPDRIELCGRVMPFAQIGGLSIYGRNNVVFSFDGAHWEITGTDRFAALKYEYAYLAAKNRS